MESKITKEELQKWSREDLIQLILVRNDDAKDYAKTITKLQKKMTDFTQDKTFWIYLTLIGMFMIGGLLFPLISFMI